MMSERKQDGIFTKDKEIHGANIVWISAQTGKRLKT